MKDKRKILVVVGTRPEAIKMAPVIFALKNRPDFFETRICLTAQHREMLDQVMSFFGIQADYDLNLMKPGQALHQLTSALIHDMDEVLLNFKPACVLVHGDTTTSFAAALASFYRGIPVAHVEAGLRTYNKLAPFPEEINRQLTARIASIHFSPTKVPASNLLQEHIPADDIFVTGNTVIDALLMAVDRLKSYTDASIENLKTLTRNYDKIVLITGHRRENFGTGFENICHALATIAREQPHVLLVYPVHLNPNVQEPVNRILGNISNIKLVAPLEYPAFVWLMQQAYLIITDSGGIQEEAPTLGKPVLVMREVTERPEAIDAGAVKLVGTNTQLLVSETLSLLNDSQKYNTMSKVINPYGDGNAAGRIVDVLASDRLC